MKRTSGLRVEAIKVANVPAGSRGFVEYTDLAGKLYILWDNGTEGVIQERGETYKIIEVKDRPKKIFWKLKKFFVVLRNITKPKIYEFTKTHLGRMARSRFYK
jgi:hypothetical protein